MIYLIIFLTEIFVFYKISRRLVGKFARSIYLLHIVFLPGTFVHELSHFAAAKILFVRTGKLSLIPEKISDREVKLGYMEVAKADPVRSLLIGVAPFIFGNAIIFSLLYFMSHNNLYNDWRAVALVIFVIFEVGNTMFSSKKDLEGAWKFFLILALVFLPLYLLGVRVQLSLDVNFLLKDAVRFMLVPIGVDLIFLFLFQKAS